MFVYPIAKRERISGKRQIKLLSTVPVYLVYSCAGTKDNVTKFCTSSLLFDEVLRLCTSSLLIFCPRKFVLLKVQSSRQAGVSLNCCRCVEQDTTVISVSDLKAWKCDTPRNRDLEHCLKHMRVRTSSSRIKCTDHRLTPLWFPPACLQHVHSTA